MGRAIHKIDDFTRPKKMRRNVGIVGGIASGLNKVCLEQKGKEQSKVDRHAGWASSAILNTPTLASEVMASHRGLKLLKEAGASKEVMKRARKNLALAGGTYAAGAIMNIGLAEGARSATIGALRSAPKIKQRRENKK